MFGISAVVDNSKMEQVESKGGVINFSGSMDYSYTLFSYNENGKGKDITFGASGELKEGAFIRFTVMPICGVLEWKEVRISMTSKNLCDKIFMVDKKEIVSWGGDYT